MLSALMRGTQIAIVSTIWASCAFGGSSGADNPAIGIATFFIKAGTPEIQGSLSTLKIPEIAKAGYEGKHYSLVYFGTSYRVGSCSTDLLVIDQAIHLLENRCGSEMADLILPILVYPEGKAHSRQEARNLDTYIATPDARIVGFSGSTEDVIAIAKQYKASYELDEEGLVQSHTRFIYLMSPSGKNLAIIEEGTPFGFITERIIQQFQADGLLGENSNPNCNTTY